VRKVRRLDLQGGGVSVQHAARNAAKLVIMRRDQLLLLCFFALVVHGDFSRPIHRCASPSRTVAHRRARHNAPTRPEREIFAPMPGISRCACGLRLIVCKVRRSRHAARFVA